MHEQITGEINRDREDTVWTGAEHIQTHEVGDSWLSRSDLTARTNGAGNKVWQGGERKRSGETGRRGVHLAGRFMMDHEPDGPSWWRWRARVCRWIQRANHWSLPIYAPTPLSVFSFFFTSDNSGMVTQAGLCSHSNVFLWHTHICGPPPADLFPPFVFFLRQFFPHSKVLSSSSSSALIHVCLL